MVPWVSTDESPFAPCDEHVRVRASNDDTSAAEAEPNRVALVKWLLSLKEGRPFAELRCSAGEPGWDILMDLYVNQLQGRPTSVTSACIGSRVPPTTALRYVNALCDAGRMERQRDANDARRYWLTLPAGVITEIEGYLAGLTDTLVTLLRR